MRFSLCVLSYKRPEMLKQCLQSIIETRNKPTQIIVNSDGGDWDNTDYLVTACKQKQISNLIINNGDNRGVGRSFQNALSLAEGDIVLKIDSDIIFRPGWQDITQTILSENPDVGAVSLFDYRYYDPNDTRFKVELERRDCFIVNDFVSSVYAFRHGDIPKLFPPADDGNHTKLGTLAITKHDYVKNQGFGVGKSVYVSGTMEHPYKTPTFAQPFWL